MFRVTTYSVTLLPGGGADEQQNVDQTHVGSVRTNFCMLVLIIEESLWEYLLLSWPAGSRNMKDDRPHPPLQLR